MTTGLEVAPDWLPTASQALTTSMPPVTEPYTTCLPSSQSVLTVHRKNCEPLVPGPALAMDRMPSPARTRGRSATRQCTRATWALLRAGGGIAAQLTGVLEGEVLVRELLAVDGLAAGAVAAGEVATLAHELRDDAVEGGALEVERLARLAHALLAGAEATEVLWKIATHTDVE
jgi:hypothetical protein